MTTLSGDVDGGGERLKSFPSVEEAGVYFTVEMKNELEDTFSMLSNDRGEMPIRKLKLAMKSLGMDLTNDELDFFLSKASDNFMKFDLFSRIVMSYVSNHSSWSQREMNEIFAIYDRDGNNFVEAKELRRLFMKMGEPPLDLVEVEDQLREYDVDGDAQMVISEFYKMIAKTKGSDFLFDSDNTH